MNHRLRFVGEITGAGTRSGTRLIVGRWSQSPFGPIADAMIETAGGHRVLVAPSAEVADFIAATYQFDEIRVESNEVHTHDAGFTFESASLIVGADVGPRTALGRLLTMVPARVAISRSLVPHRRSGGPAPTPRCPHGGNRWRWTP